MLLTLLDEFSFAILDLYEHDVEYLRVRRRVRDSLLANTIADIPIFGYLRWKVFGCAAEPLALGPGL